MDELNRYPFVSGLLTSISGLSWQEAQFLSRQSSNVTEDFVEEFAHDKCYVLAEGFLIAGQRSFLQVDVVVISEFGIDLHYLNSINIDGHKFYIDAYGLFDNLDKIARRYHIDDVSMSVQVFDYSGYQARKDLAEIMADAISQIRTSMRSPAEYVRFRDNACWHLINSITADLD